MKKALLTGSHGFIGVALTKFLQSRDIEVIELERDALYADIPSLIELFYHYKPNYIVHLAAYGNMRHQNAITQMVMANYFSIYNLLKASEFIEYDAFINVGTSSMYGKKTEPMKETDSMLPSTFYAATKLGGAMLARAYALQLNKPIATVLPFSVYGEGEALHRFIPRVVEHLISSQTLSLTSQEHDWIYISDLLEGMMTVIKHIDSLKGEFVNIGTGIETKNSEIVGELEEISNKRLNYTPDNNLSTQDSPKWVADTSGKLSTFGWSPKISLQEGLKRCWEYYSDDKE